MAAFSRLKVLGVITVMNGGTSASLDLSPWPNPQNTPLADRQGRCRARYATIRPHGRPPPAWPKTPKSGRMATRWCFCQPGGPGSSTYN